MVVLSLMSALTFSVFSAGNVSDTIINISARSNNGGTPCRSIWREKKDYTSVWCENKSTSGGSLSAWVQRTNNKNTSSVKTVDRYYGSWSYNGATKNMKIYQRVHIIICLTMLKKTAINMLLWATL